MDIETYLKLNRQYELAEEPLLSIFENGAKELGLDVKYIVIKSNQARNEAVTIGGVKYIVWDIMYWDVYRAHFTLSMNIDLLHDQKDKLHTHLHYIALNIFDFMGDHFESINSEASKVFRRYCWQYGWNKNLRDYEHDYVDSCIYLSKLFVAFHEQYHLYFEMNSRNKTNVENNIRVALKNLKPKILKDFEDYYNSSRFYYFEKHEFEDEFLELIENEKSPVPEELLVDAAAFYQTFSAYCGVVLENKSQWTTLIPLIRNSIETFRFYSVLIKTLIKIADNCIYNPSIAEKKALEFNKSHAKELFFRERLLTYIEVDQLISIFREYDYYEIIKIYSQQDVRPYRESYYKHIQPYCQSIAKQYIIPMLT